MVLHYKRFGVCLESKYCIRPLVGTEDIGIEVRLQGNDGRLSCGYWQVALTNDDHDPKRRSRGAHYSPVVLL